MKKIIKASPLIVALFAMIGCKKQISPDQQTDDPAASTKLRQWGTIPAKPEAYAKMVNYELFNKMLARVTTCPSSVDLTASFPAPGDQGYQQSGTSWAVGYAAKSYMEGVAGGWSPTTSNHQFSPQYLYSQVHVDGSSGGGGSLVSDNLDIINNQGISTLDVTPNVTTAYGYLTTPSADATRQAFRFRNLYWAALYYGDVAGIKLLLCNNYPVIQEIEVYPDFDNLNSSNDTYDNTSGSWLGWHTITLTGYDDTRQAFSFINSLGTSWGVGGYGWISYNLIANNAWGSYFMGDDVNPIYADTWESTSSAGISTIGYFSGDMNADGNTDIIHPWNNSGTLAIIAHGLTGTSSNIICNNTISGAGSTNVGFAPADFNGDGKTDLVQGWKNGNNLALTVFTSSGTSFSRAYDVTTSSGYQNLKLLPVDMDGDGKTDIAHLWNNGGSLGLIIYKSNGTSYSNAYSTTLSNGSGNVGFIPADYDGDGKTDIIHLWNNSGSLGVSVIKSSGTSYSTVWTGTMSQGSGNVGFVPVDYDADGKMDFIQGYQNGTKLNLLLYKSDGSSYSYVTNIETRHGYQNLALLPEKQSGISKTGFIQAWNNSNYTAFIRYPVIVY